MNFVEWWFSHRMTPNRADSVSKSARNSWKIIFFQKICKWVITRLGLRQLNNIQSQSTNQVISLMTLNLIFLFNDKNWWTWATGRCDVTTGSSDVTMGFATVAMTTRRPRPPWRHDALDRYDAAAALHLTNKAVSVSSTPISDVF